MEEYKKCKEILFKYHIYFSIIVLSFFYTLNLIKEANGYILGAVVALINFYLMAKVNEKIHILKEKFNSYSTKWFFLRYLLFALALIASLKKDYFAISGTILGLLSMQLVIFFSLITGRLKV